MLKRITAGAALLCLFNTHVLADISISETDFRIKNTVAAFNNKPFTYQNEVYIPSYDVFKAINYSVGWSDQLKAIKLYGNDLDSALFINGDTHLVGYGTYRYKNPVIMRDGCVYVPMSLFEDIAGEKVSINGYISPIGYSSDEYRIPENDFKDCENCYVINREYMFMPTFIDDEAARNYAAIINMFVDKLPGVNVYSMLVPDSCEIYAPERFCSEQSSSFERIYGMLSERVRPVAVTESLYAHADQKIYFSTDHHWTQRGAYYAWKAFADMKEAYIPELNEFATSSSDRFIGSYVKNLKGVSAADILDLQYELIERFMPLYSVTATVYSDSGMTQKMGKVPFINTTNNTYSSFLSGDHPLTVIEGGIKNGKKLALIKDSFGNALVTWAVNNYETIYVIDERGFAGGRLKIDEFYSRTGFDDLIIESYPTSIKSGDLRTNLLEFVN